MEQEHERYDWMLRLLESPDLAIVHKDIVLSKNMVIPSTFINVSMLMDTFVVIVLLHGYVCGRIDEEVPFMQRGTGIVMFFPGQQITLDFISEDFDAFCVMTSNSFFEKLNVGGLASYFHCVPCRAASSAKIKGYCFFFDMLCWMMTARGKSNRLRLVADAMELFFQEEESEAYSYRIVNDVESKGLLYRYTNLIKLHYRTYHDICFYANALNLSPKYFAATIKRISGRSALEWINEYIVFRAIDLIRTTDLSMKEIAFQLGFPSPASFGNYFKRSTGKSPGDYRKKEF